MEKVTSQLTSIIKSISELGIGLIALGIIAEIVFGQGAIFGASVVGNLSGIVTAIGGGKRFRWLSCHHSNLRTAAQSRIAEP